MFVEMSSHLVLIYDGMHSIKPLFLCFQTTSIALEYMENHRKMTFLPTETVLRSAVGMTHVLRSRLVMDYTTSYFPLIVLGYHFDFNRSYGPLSGTCLQCV